jgi:hypothetical protein
MRDAVHLLQPQRQRDACVARQFPGVASRPAAAHVGRQFEQGQWVALGLVQHQTADARIEPGVVQVQELLGHLLRQRGDRQFRQRGRVEAGGHAGAQTDDELHRASGQPAPHETAHLGAGGVEPLAVVEYQ